METVDQDSSHAHPMFVIDGATVPGALFSVGEAQDTRMKRGRAHTYGLA